VLERILCQVGTSTVATNLTGDARIIDMLVGQRRSSLY
jgi:hypothetical protein